MEQQTKAALTTAATGFGVNQYLKQKQRKSPEGYLGKTDEQLKMLGGATAVLATASAVIFETTKDNPKARKIAFIALGVGTVGFIALVVSAVRSWTNGGSLIKKDEK